MHYVTTRQPGTTLLLLQLSLDRIGTLRGWRRRHVRRLVAHGVLRNRERHCGRCWARHIREVRSATNSRLDDFRLSDRRCPHHQPSEWGSRCQPVAEHNHQWFDQLPLSRWNNGSAQHHQEGRVRWQVETHQEAPPERLADCVATASTHCGTPQTADCHASPGRAF